MTWKRFVLHLQNNDSEGTLHERIRWRATTNTVWGGVKFFRFASWLPLCLSSLHWEFNSIESDEIKLPVNKTKWTSLLEVKIPGLDLCKIWPL